MIDTGTLLLGLLFSSIGLGYFIYGKRQANLVAKYAGLALMVFPYFVHNHLAIIVIGIALMALPKYVDF